MKIYIYSIHAGVLFQFHIKLTIDLEIATKPICNCRLSSKHVQHIQSLSNYHAAKSWSMVRPTYEDAIN